MKIGNIFIALGIILIACAFGIFLYNELEDANAGKSANYALEVLRDSLAEHALVEMSPEAAAQDSGENGSGSGTSDAGSKGIENYEARKSSLGELYPEREMPTTVVDEYLYCGVLEIPSLGLSLPIMDSWSYPQLKVAPCRYSGSIYMHNMVIAGHSYRNHFRPLYNVAIGAEVRFYDAENHLYRYVVANRETLRPTQGAVLTEDSDDWDLTLFTCTPGGQTRCVVRCQLLE